MSRTRRPAPTPASCGGPGGGDGRGSRWARVAEACSQPPCAAKLRDERCERAGPFARTRSTPGVSPEARPLNQLSGTVSGSESRNSAPVMVAIDVPSAVRNRAWKPTFSEMDEMAPGAPVAWS